MLNTGSQLPTENVDPFAPTPNTWKPPPLRYPKGKIKLEDLQKEQPKVRAPRMGDTFPHKSTAKGSKSSKQESQDESSSGIRRFSQAREEDNAYERGYESKDRSTSPKTQEELDATETQAEVDRLSRLQQKLSNFCMDRKQRPTYESEPQLYESDKNAAPGYLHTMRECIHRAEVQSGDKSLICACNFLQWSYSSVKVYFCALIGLHCAPGSILRLFHTSFTISVPFSSYAMDEQLDNAVAETS